MFTRSRSLTRWSRGSRFRRHRFFFPRSMRQWAMQIVILILVVGFPIALVFSWAFEITPEGIKRESEVQADESITHHTGRKLVALTIVLAVIAAGLFVFQLLRPRAHP